MFNSAVKIRRATDEDAIAGAMRIAVWQDGRWQESWSGAFGRQAHFLNFEAQLRHRSAFTLVELLVVIGIIALLISILIPVLGQARRSAGNVKCLSSLKQIGAGLQFYAQEFDNTLPPVAHNVNNLRLPIGPSLFEPNGAVSGVQERRWTDLLAKYFVSSELSKQITNSIGVRLLRGNSVIWGCPQWSRSDELVDNSAYIDLTSSGGPRVARDEVRTGYGMNPYSWDFFRIMRNGTTTGTLTVAETAWRTQYTSIARSGMFDRGTYMRVQQYAARRSSETGIVADSMEHLLQVPSESDSAVWTSANPWLASVNVINDFRWQPGPGPSTSNTYNFSGNPTRPLFYVEGSRHSGPGTRKSRLVSEKGMNMLFVDGHASAVSVSEAFTAVTGLTTTP